MAFFSRVVAAALLAAASFGAVATASGADLQWAPYGSLTGNSPAFSLAGDPAAAGTIYAATLGSGLVRTTDGKTWGQVDGNALPKRLWRVVIDASKGPNGGAAPVYVGTSGQGFFKSLDGGGTWQQLSNGLSSAAGAQNVRAIALGRQLIVIGTSDGVYKSTDGGKSWQAMGLQGLDVSAVTFAQYSNPTVILAGIDGTRDAGSRLVRTVDLGANWIPLTQGVPTDLVVTTIAAGPVPSGQNLRPLFVAGSGGVYKSDDGGQDWAQLSGLPPQGFNALVTSPYDSNIVYAASDGGGGGGGGVWRSTDRGASWAAPHRRAQGEVGDGPGPGPQRAGDAGGRRLEPRHPRHLPPYLLNDTQAVPQGQPEGGVCPEPGTDAQCAALSAGASNIPPAFAPQNACASPSPSPATSASTPSSPAASSSTPGLSAASPSPRPLPPPACPSAAPPPALPGTAREQRIPAAHLDTDRGARSHWRYS